MTRIEAALLIQPATTNDARLVLGETWVDPLGPRPGPVEREELKNDETTIGATRTVEVAT